MTSTGGWDLIAEEVWPWAMWHTLVRRLCNKGVLDASRALGLKERPGLKIDKRFCGSNSLLPLTNSLLFETFSLLICVGNCAKNRCGTGILNPIIILPWAKHNGLSRFRPDALAASIGTSHSEATLAATPRLSGSRTAAGQKQAGGLTGLPTPRHIQVS